MGVLNFRRYARVEVDIPIKFFPKDSEEPLNAYLNNISEEGSSLICPFTIPVATILEFDIRLPKISLPVHVRSEVLWARPIKDNGQSVFAHGLMFSHLNIEDRQRLHEFIAHAMSY